MKARVDYFCKPAKKNANYECESIYMEVELPFVPAVGTMLKLTEEGDFVKINDVMLDISPGGHGLLVGLEEPEHVGELRPWSEMKAQGWKLDCEAQPGPTSVDSPTKDSISPTTVGARLDPERAYLRTVAELQELARQAPFVTQEWVLQVASMDQDDMRRRLIRNYDWHGHFSHCLDGIQEIKNIGGGGIDGCRSHKEVRAIVLGLLREIERLKTSNPTSTA